MCGFIIGDGSPSEWEIYESRSFHTKSNVVSGTHSVLRNCTHMMNEMTKNIIKISGLNISSMKLWL